MRRFLLAGSFVRRGLRSNSSQIVVSTLPNARRGAFLTRALLQVRQCSGKTGIRDETNVRIGAPVISESGDEDSQNDENSENSDSVYSEEEQDSVESAEEVSDEDEDVDEDEDIDLEEAEARLSNAEKPVISSGDVEEISREEEPSDNELIQDEDKDSKKQKKKKKKSYVHKLSIEEVEKILEELRPIDLKIIDVRDRCQWTDYMVFVSGRTVRHIRGMADMIVDAVKKQSTRENHYLFPTVEGRDCEDWMLVDCGHIVVHAFSIEARARYRLEDKWSGKDVFNEDDSPPGDGENQEEAEEDIFDDPTFPPQRPNTQEV